MMKRAVWYLGFLWCLPLTGINLLVAFCYGWGFCARATSGWGWALVIGVKRIRIGFKDTAGQSFSVVAMLDETIMAELIANRPALAKQLLRYECRHTQQALVLGLLFPIAYGVACVVAWARGGNWYKDNWFEKDARRAASAK